MLIMQQREPICRATPAPARTFGLVLAAALALPVPMAAQASVMAAQTDRPASVLTAAGATEQVPISLAEAEAEALAGNRALKAAEAQAQAAAAGARGAEAFLWPGLQANAGVLRTDDPVGVFGTKLRQQRFTEMDFALPALNRPDAVSDWSAGIGARWDVASPSRWFLRSAARAGAEAAELGIDRTEEAVRFQTRIYYFEALRAEGTRAAAAAALEAARATAERMARRVDEGLGTEAERLQAQAAEASARARVEMAEAGVADAYEALGAHLGWPSDRIPVPSERQPGLQDRSTAGESEATPLLQRADLQASALGVDAARAQARAAGAQRMPALQAFGQVGTHAPGLSDDRGTNWTVGVQLSLPIFTGFGLSAAHDAAAAQARAADADHAARVRQATVEMRSARRGLGAAREALVAVSSAQQAAAEAVRLLRRRHEEGMTTLADLLQAEAQAADLDARLVEAQTGVQMALAYLDFALGDAR